MGKQWKQWLTYFFGLHITADGDCSHEIKRRSLLGRKVMTNLDSIFKSRDIILPTKVHLVKAMVFPAVMYGIPDHLTCLLRNLYAGQEAAVRTRHGTDRYQIRKRVSQGCILSLCLFNLYAEYIMWKQAEWSTAGKKNTRRNINNLRYADDTTLMAESEEELKSLLEKVKEESEKVGLIQHSEN